MTAHAPAHPRPHRPGRQHPAVASRADPSSTADPSTPAVSTRGLVRDFGRGENTVRALDGIDLDLARGELTAIMGASGSGKSTLLHVLAGLDAVDRGSIRIDGTEITRMTDTELTLLRRARIGFVFQSFNLLPMLSARENILLPLDLAGRRVDPVWMRTVVDALGLADRLSHLPSQLSGGQIQRVAIARALITRPAVVFADEPTGNLDSATTDEVLDFLRLSVEALGQTVVMVTHEREAAERADRILTLADGRILADERVR
ncbi:ABC transporter ATP-binding protein [Brachybacterium huguangmaarense]